MLCVPVCVHFSTLLLLLPTWLVSLAPSGPSSPRDVESGHGLASFTIMALMNFRSPHGDFSTFNLGLSLSVYRPKPSNRQTNKQKPKPFPSPRVLSESFGLAQLFLWEPPLVVVRSRVFLLF